MASIIPGGRSSGRGSGTMFNVRLRGWDPRIEAEHSNLSLVLNSRRATAANAAALTLLNAAHPLLHVAAEVGGVALCASDRPAGAGAGAYQPFVSLRTARDREGLRVDADGVAVDVLRAGVYTNLVDSYTATDVFRPPTAGALAGAYVALSNMVVQHAAAAGGSSNGGNVAAPPAGAALLDTFTSTSLLDAPTANALRAAYYSLSNTMAVRLRSVWSALPGLVESVLASAGMLGSNYDGLGLGGGGGGSNGLPAGGGAAATPAFSLSNDGWAVSYPDFQPRVLPMLDGMTAFGAAASGPAPAPDMPGGQLPPGEPRTAFAWWLSDMQQDLMRLSAEGGLWARGALRTPAGASVGGGLDVGSNLRVAGALELGGGGGGGVLITHAGSNLGINLPPGQDPACALHVNGAVFSMEQLFTLSDREVKDDIRPLERPLERLQQITGCTYVRRDEAPSCCGAPPAPQPAARAEGGGAGPGQAAQAEGEPQPEQPQPQRRRHVGVIAQDVYRALPEAVLVAPDGRMSVAYGNLVAVAIEGIKELARQREEDRRELACLRQMVAQLVK